MQGHTDRTGRGVLWIMPTKVEKLENTLKWLELRKRLYIRHTKVIRLEEIRYLMLSITAYKTAIELLKGGVCK